MSSEGSDTKADLQTFKYTYVIISYYAQAKPEIAFAAKVEEENPRREKGFALREEETFAGEMRGLQETVVRCSQGKGFGNFESPEDQETSGTSLRWELMLVLHAQEGEERTL